MTSDPFEAGATAAGAVAFTIDPRAGTVELAGNASALGLNGAALSLDDFLSRMGPTDQDALQADLASGRLDVRIRLTGQEQELSYVRLIGAAHATGLVNGLMIPAGDTAHKAKRIADEHALAAAVTAGEVLAFYQPIVCLKSQRLAGFEALARWRRPGIGVLAPPDFLAMADDIDQLGKLSSNIRSNAVDDLAAWRRSSRPAEQLFVAANVSVSELVDRGFQDRIIAYVRRAELPAGVFKLEIAETEIMRDPEAAADAMARLSEAGIALALDDFGTGYSSLARLEMLPFDVVKIDQYFVRAMVGNESAATVVQSVIQLAKHFEMKVVAEGVETEETARILTEIGCDFAQGYRYSGAVAPQEAFGLIGSGVENRFKPAG